MTNVSVFAAVIRGELESVTLKTMVKEPLPVGVPDSTPVVELSRMPYGNVPVWDHL
jgi:hypothetical protein